VWGGTGNELTGNVPVNLIFLGGSTGFGFDGSVTAQQITTAANNLFSSAYFSGLIGGNQPTLSVQASYVDTRDGLPASFQVSDVINGVVRNSLQDNGGPLADTDNFGPYSLDPNGIYVVFLPPKNGSGVPYALGGQPNAVGVHGFGSPDGKIGDSDNAPTAVVMSAQNTFSLNHKNDSPNTPDAFVSLNALDSITTILSHELVETLTHTDTSSEDGTQVDATPQFYQAYPQVTENPGELGDNEAEMHYGFVNCVAVQSYWYAFNTEFYGIPDGTRQRLCLQGQSLIIGGDRLGPADKQTLDISAVAGGVQVILNGDTYQYAPGQVSSIRVDLGAGANTHNVDGLPAGVSLTVTEAAGANDTVNLGPSSKNLADIQGPVSVQGEGPTNDVTLGGFYGGTWTDTLSGPRGGSLPLGSFTFSYGGLATFSLSPAQAVTLTLQGGPFATELDTVTDAGAGSIQFNGAQPDHGTLRYASVSELDDLVKVSSAAYDFTGAEGVFSPSVAVRDGPVVNGLQTTSLQQKIVYLEGGRDWWLDYYRTVMDPVSFANKGDVTVQSGSQNASIDLNNPNPAAGLATLEIDPGIGTTNVTVESTPGILLGGARSQSFAPDMKAGGGGGGGGIFSTVATTVTSSGRAGDVETVTLHGAQGVQAILGTVDVENPNAYRGARTNLVIDDTGDTKGRAGHLLDGRLTGLAPATITWGAVSSLTVTGGSGGNSFTVGSFGNLPTTVLNAGRGGDTFTVTVSAMSRYQLTVNGGPGYDQLDIDVLSAALGVSQGHGWVSVSSPVKDHGSGISYKDIEDLNVNQLQMLPPPPGNGGGDGNGGLPMLSPSPGGGAQDPLQPAQPRHKARKLGGPSHRPRHAAGHGKRARRSRGK
jgi:hypothetical protein